MMVPSEDERKTLAAFLKKNKGDASKLGPSEQVTLILPLPHSGWLLS